MPFSCSICEEESTRICVSCTKDTCSNHLCERCAHCSDCCTCEVRLDEPGPVHAPVQHAESEPVEHFEEDESPPPEPVPHPHPGPDPDPAPDEPILPQPLA
jgi:hypothetical protein